MFDFIKTNVKEIKPTDLTNNPLLNFSLTVDSDGAVVNRIAEYLNLKIKINNETYININGSLHKYYNSGLHNYNNFTIINLVEVCSDLSLKFGINPYTTLLHNLEFGVNVIVPFTTNEVLNSIISYKGKEYEVERYNGKGYLLRFSFEHYELKIYNKGLQYGQGKNILRFEIKVRRMEYFKKREIEINCLADLLNPSIYKKLETALLAALNELVFYDKSVPLAELNQRERTVLINGRNPKYWTGLKEQGKEIKKIRARFNQLVLKHGNLAIKSTLRNLIEQKLVEITKITTSTQEKINLYLSQFSQQTLPEITVFETAISNTNFTQNNHSNIGLIQTQIKRYCVSCGRDISNQKKDSKFCSEKQFGRAAKKCRNMESNFRHNSLKKESRLYSGILLFDVSEYKTARIN
ncbi:MAG: hypothetical protein IPN99_00425 [Bacteroidetes bacterium]|nr:hypothetical protein [Bacteroidota bacterium]